MKRRNEDASQSESRGGRDRGTGREVNLKAEKTTRIFKAVNFDNPTSRGQYPTTAVSNSCRHCAHIWS